MFNKHVNNKLSDNVLYSALNYTVAKGIVFIDSDNNNYILKMLIDVSLIWNRCLHSVSETFHHCQADHHISIEDLVKKHSKYGLLIALYFSLVTTVCTVI